MASRSVPAILREHRSSLDTVSFTPSSSITNATFGVLLCNLIAPETQILVISTAIPVTTTIFALPDCFYANTSSVAFLSMDNVIIQGNATYPDPLERVMRASPYVGTFALSGCYLRTDTGAKATINWDVLTSAVVMSSVTLSGAGIGIGSTLPTLSRYLQFLILSNSGIGGTLPDKLFAIPPASGSMIFWVDVSNNALEGTIPASFYSNLNVSTFDGVSINFENNRLNGSIPPAFISGSFSQASNFVFKFGNNDLHGSLGQLFASTTFNLTLLKSFSFSGSGNNLTGTLPIWLSHMPSLADYEFSCSFCNLQGTVPASFFAVSSRHRATITVTLTGNNFTGAIPPELFLLPSSPSNFLISLDQNNLESLPPNLFDNTNFTATSQVRIDLSRNKLSGNLPNTLGLFGGLSSLLTHFLDVSSNPTLAGTVPPTVLESFIPSGSEPITSTASISIALGSTNLTGYLPVPNFASAPGLKLSLHASSANFTTFTSPISAGSGLYNLAIDNNPLLTGSLPPAFFQNNPHLTNFNASYTQLSGLLPDIGTANPAGLYRLDLASTLIDFCSGNRTTWTSSVVGFCILDVTSAYYCSDLYPQCSTSAPLTPTAPETPIESPTPTFVPTPTGCSQSTRPTPEWTCVDGIWTFAGSVNSTVITIPSGSQTTTIKGNLTSSTVIINGLNSVLVIEGCTSNTTILVELTPQQLEEIGKNGKLQQLLSLSNASSCNTSLSDTIIGTRVKGSSCKKVSVSKVPSSNGTLSGLFKIDNGGCNKWWIILVSVLCAVIAIALVAAIVAYVVIQKRSEGKAHKSLKGQM